MKEKEYFHLISETSLIELAFLVERRIARRSLTVDG